MIFRKAILEDIDALEALEQGVVEAERPFNDAIAVNARYYNLKELIQSDESNLLIVEDNGEIIATGYIQIRDSKASLSHDKHGYLGFMYVSPEHRGKGLNKQVIDNLITWGKDRAIADFYLDVYAENASAVKAYEKVGFKSCLLEMRLSS